MYYITHDMGERAYPVIGFGLQIKQLCDILVLSNIFLVCVSSVSSVLFTFLYDLLSLFSRKRLDGGLMHLICWSSQVMTEVILLWMPSWLESSNPMMESAISMTTMNTTSPLYWSANIYWTNLSLFLSLCVYIQYIYVCVCVRHFFNFYINVLHFTVIYLKLF